MPTAVMFHQQGKAHTVYFTHPQAVLPVRLKNGEIRLVKWGRRSHENSEMPLGGWAMQSAIHQGKWNYFLPKPVKLFVEKFLKIDFEGQSQWYEVTKGRWIQGILLQEEGEYRVYVVVMVPDRLDISYSQWPKVVIA